MELSWCLKTECEESKRCQHVLVGRGTESCIPGHHPISMEQSCFQPHTCQIHGQKHTHVPHPFEHTLNILQSREMQARAACRRTPTSACRSLQSLRPICPDAVFKQWLVAEGPVTWHLPFLILVSPVTTEGNKKP